MKTKYRRMAIFVLACILVLGATLVVQAKTVTGSFSDGTYGINLTKRSSTNAAASISVTLEEPSAPSVWVRQQGSVVGSSETLSLDASGYNGCYKERTLSNIQSARCRYWVGSLYAGELTF